MTWKRSAHPGLVFPSEGNGENRHPSSPCPQGGKRGGGLGAKENIARSREFALHDSSKAVFIAAENSLFRVSTTEGALEEVDSGENKWFNFTRGLDGRLNVVHGSSRRAISEQGEILPSSPPKSDAATVLFRIGPAIESEGKRRELRIPYPFDALTLWELNPDRMIGRFRLHSQKMLMPIAFAVYNPQKREIWVLDGGTKSTYVFDHKELLDLLALQGE